MIFTRGNICFLTLLALMVAIYFFEGEVSLYRKQIGNLKSDIVKFEQDIIILKSEWSYLNNPQRLQILYNKMIEGSDAKQVFARLHNLHASQASNQEISLVANSPIPVQYINADNINYQQSYKASNVNSYESNLSSF